MGIDRESRQSMTPMNDQMSTSAESMNNKQHKNEHNEAANTRVRLPTPPSSEELKDPNI
jgi:hypothetical protein